MAERTAERHPIVRTLVPLGIVFVLLHLAHLSDILSGLTRPLVIGLLHLVGVTASDQAGDLVVGRLHVPWTRDCAGLNVLMVLLALTVWTNRLEPNRRRYWGRVVLTVPAAFLANVARILTLIAYRWLLYPAVESPQLHYFIGFLWLMPLLRFFVPRGGRANLVYGLETLFLAAVLSLLAPFMASPGGSLVAVATLVFLAGSHYRPAGTPGAWVGTLIWTIAAVLIAMASMESLWIPWLLACPRFVRPSLLRSPTGLVLLAGTIPVLAMHPVAPWLMLPAAAYEMWRLRHPPESAVASPANLPVPSLWAARLGAAGLALLTMLPFVASSIGGWNRSRELPPTGLMVRSMDINSYQVRLIGQPPDLTLTWYCAYGEGRHHTLPVCMRYRGILLRPTHTEATVMTDGEVWMKEFFFQRNELLLSYGDYLRHTFSPLSAPGVHVIASCPAQAMSAPAFARLTERLAGQLRAMGGPVTTGPESPRTASR